VGHGTGVLVGREGRRDRHRVHRRPTDVPEDIQGQGRRRQGRPEGRQLRDLEGPDRRTTPARKCWPRTWSADDKFLGGVNFYVKGVEGKVRRQVSDGLPARTPGGHWHPAALKGPTGGALGTAPLAVQLLGQPPVAVLLARPACLARRRRPGPGATAARTAARRSVAGLVRDGQLECPYHGWRFSGSGAGGGAGVARLHAAGQHMRHCLRMRRAHMAWCGCGWRWMARYRALPRLRRRRRCPPAQGQLRPLRRGHQRAAHRRELSRHGALRLRA
jgi:hypothetical protein